LGVRLALLAALGAGGMAFWFREQTASAYFSAQDAVVGTFGLGVVPAALWLAAFLWTMARGRSSFRHARLWLGSLVFLALIWGILGLFEPAGRTLAAFTLDGDVSLGGHAGYAIAGPVVWQGVLRLLGAFIVGAVIVAPRLILHLATSAGRLVLAAYVLALLPLKRIASALSSMYHFDPRSRFARSERVRERAGSPRRPRELSTGPATDQPRAWRSRTKDPIVEEAVAQSEARVVATLMPTIESTDVGTIPELDQEKLEAPAPEPEPDPAGQEQSEPSLPASGKYNRFWDEHAGPDSGNGVAALHGLGENDAERDQSGDGPILDSMGALWKRPPSELLEEITGEGISEAEMVETGQTIKRTLAEYGVEVEIGQIKPGPTVTMYGLVPGWVRRYKQVKVTDESGLPKRDELGKPVTTRVETKTRVKVDAIMSREKDLALALKTPSIRIETPVMGESFVGIEVPNPASTLVTLRGVMESEKFKKMRDRTALPIALGKGSGGDPAVVDLAKMPHLLIAGSTGSGKSVCINSIISCLIMENTPSEMRLLLVDPKRVELTPYNGIPHLLTPVVVETDQVVALLKGLIREMLARYRRMEEVAVRNIEAYNKKMDERMPYLVVAVDELADLMMAASFDVEQSLCRLAQLGRATGIHLIIATQRPSVDVITGLIKANFPTRLSFGVTSQIDSRTILDTAGAEKLLGRGDMLYLSVDSSRPERVQGVFISDREIENLVRFWKTTPWAPLSKVSLHAVGEADRDVTEEDNRNGSRDALLDNAVDLAQRYNKLSTSLLQRRLRIGYPRAARLMDQLEDEGIVGPSDGSKSRDVIISNM
jgi:S-DNA-T family DNA segregation ATPase FtsK/SpoIIIE